jgi:hypothetical protein
LTDDIILPLQLKPATLGFELGKVNIVKARCFQRAFLLIFKTEKSPSFSDRLVSGNYK